MPGAVVSVSCELTNLIPKAKSPPGGEVTPALGSRGMCSQPIRFFCSFQVIRCIQCNGYHSNWKRAVQWHLYFILVLLHPSLSTKLFSSHVADALHPCISNSPSAPLPHLNSAVLNYLLPESFVFFHVSLPLPCDRFCLKCPYLFQFPTLVSSPPP